MAGLFGALALSLVVNSAHAQSAAPATLEVTEAAYANVDFQTAYDTGQRTLALGQSTLAESARLHVLVGISAAALGKNDEARQHFTVALVIDPELELDRDLSPKLRGPYLEARGSLASLGRPLELEGKARPESRRLVLGLRDPLNLTKKIEIAVWPLGAARPNVTTLPAARTIPVELPATYWNTGFEYWARAVDAQGNPLFELGRETAPISVHPVPAAAVAVDMSVTPVAPPRARKTPWVPIALGAVGVVAAGTGGYFNWQREHWAHKWNGAQCEQPGSTRYQQCRGIDDDRRRAEQVAITGYAVGGALITTAAVWLIAGGTSSKENAANGAKLECGSSFAALELHCSGRW